LFLSESESESASESASELESALEAPESGWALAQELESVQDYVWMQRYV
jgi:hypothetical protein